MVIRSSPLEQNVVMTSRSDLQSLAVGVVSLQELQSGVDGAGADITVARCTALVKVRHCG